MSGKEERLEMVNDFITESREMLNDLEPHITELEKNSLASGEVDDEMLNSIFRLFHSIKGMASFLDLRTVMTVTHEAETLLDLVRKGQLDLQPRHVDVLYRTSDFVRGLLDAIGRQLDDAGFEEPAQTIILDIKETLQSESAADPADQAERVERAETEAVGATNVEERARPDEREQVVAAESETVVGELKIGDEMVARFCEEALEQLEEAESLLLKLEEATQPPELVEQLFRAFHSFKGNAGFFGYADMEQVSHRAESCLGILREQGRRVEAQWITALLVVIDCLREGVRKLKESGDARLTEKARVVELLEQLASAPAGSAKVPGELAGKEAAEAPRSERSAGGGDDGKGGGQQVIRVDVDKLDALVDLVGELVVAEAMVAQNPDLQDIQVERLQRFEKAIMHLGKITRDLQDVAMSMRMIPLSGTFRKMYRLVRDVAMKTNRKVNLEIIGEETEVDKTIIEQISDPLVHIIRNAVDHGLEDTAQRIAAGKPEAGSIVIEAKHSTGEVWIVVKDDGKGLNREKILAKALQRGLVQGDGSELKDEEVWRLIFEPGLSTADAVTSISGRGVGMDVVKRNIEKIRGRVDIRSEIGQGTMVAIRIPLTMAIIDGMLVRVGRARYIIPINSICESVQIRAGQATVTPGGLEVVDVRGELLPVVRLHAIYRVASDCSELNEGILIIVENEGRKSCLFVDELVGQQQVVIKGMPEYMGHVRGASGFAIRGDGEVSMILDIAGIVQASDAMV